MSSEPTFDYFAYGSCMCPVDLKRSVKESTYSYIVGPATLKGYRLGFYCYHPLRKCGVLDILPDANSQIEGVLYRLPQRLSSLLDAREEGYRHERVSVDCLSTCYANVRTYTVIQKLAIELPPNDWYFQVVMRGATTCGLTEQYCWKLFQHMCQLQRHHQHFLSFRGEQPFATLPHFR
jgi:cation transport regulator ChaC